MIKTGNAFVFTVASSARSWNGIPFLRVTIISPWTDGSGLCIDGGTPGTSVCL